MFFILTQMKLSYLDCIRLVSYAHSCNSDLDLWHYDEYDMYNLSTKLKLNSHFVGPGVLLPILVQRQLKTIENREYWRVTAGDRGRRRARAVTEGDGW